MITIILQGSVSDYAFEIANHYLQLPFVSKIIMPFLGDSPIAPPMGCNSKILITTTTHPPTNGVGNRNYQIKSSYEGMQLSTTEVSVKMRNDQKVSLESMAMMHEYYEQHKAPDIIFVAGIFPTFPFHPRDHIFWGTTENLRTLFNIPFDTESLSDDYTKVLRSEAYICMHYYAKHSGNADYMVKNKASYLLDTSPLRHEAIELSERLKLFRPFPRINFEWPKYGMKEYHYEYTKQVYGEYQG